MSEVVSDSTVLIFLAKLNKLPLLKMIYPKVLIPEKVHDEVVGKGRRKGERNAIIVRNAIKEGWIEVRETETREDVNEFKLGRGESEALSLSKNLNHEEILVDDESARDAARFLGVKPRGTLFFLAEGLRKSKIDFDEYLKSLEKLIEIGFYMREEIYLEAVRMGRKIAAQKHRI
ncbi:hypothetical protein AKJ47_00085 [candidate division MSBL1 archaeon SCGC-AAA261G05]|uniref:DUF3368 domain-containing protein n=3 Tax=candidate division MSBL1 TaxID=215777 RepID=A0A133V0L1_9EURY|nr:hypothetical protein AKJ42_01985 [candidate division MSBL1 archaeon SCGC-AAA261C02]KXB04243.1 hypothetical protein AKJ47_00085 [candidate division MSBL1 archaeon SCGC-AAA261G05]KXB05107.1 hypothetical protein AKJ48_00110 [candidate division MSBL1 archaeon SCGC-AAA261O19]